MTDNLKQILEREGFEQNNSNLFSRVIFCGLYNDICETIEIFDDGTILHSIPWHDNYEGTHWIKNEYKNEEEFLEYFNCNLE